MSDLYVRIRLLIYTVTDPSNSYKFHLGYLKTSLMRYNGQMQDLVGFHYPKYDLLKYITVQYF